jgi:hypothetical protein
MKPLFIFAALAGLSAGSVSWSSSAQAQEPMNYPWCAYYNNTGTNCGFQTFAQCEADISGIGGACQPNTLYHEPRRRSRSQ